MSSATECCSRQRCLQLRQPRLTRFGRWTTLGWLAFLIAACIPLRPACAQAERPQPNHGQERVQALIEQLGAERFQQRESASAELLKIGEPALLALATAERGSDFEIRERARAIRERIERDKFDVLAQSFMRDPDPTASYGLPGWASFSRTAGTTRTAKRLFIDMIEKRRLVALSLEALDGGSVPQGVFEGLPDDPQQRLWTVIGMMCREVREALYIKGERPVPGDVIALLTAVASLDNPPQDLHDTIKSEFQFGGLNNLMSQPNSRACMRKMLGKWFLKAPVSMAEDLMSIAHQTQVPEGADLARRLLVSPAEPEAKAQALVCLAKFGTQDDLELIDTFVADATLLETFEQETRGDDILEERIAPPMREPARREEAIPGTKRRYQRLLGDVALVAGLKIAGFELQEMFTNIVQDEVLGVRLTTIGFPVDKPELREAALKTWRDFRAKKASPPQATIQPAS